MDHGIYLGLFHFCKFNFISKQQSALILMNTIILYTYTFYLQ